MDADDFSLLSNEELEETQDDNLQSLEPIEHELLGLHADLQHPIGEILQRSANAGDENDLIFVRDDDDELTDLEDAQATGDTKRSHKSIANNYFQNGNIVFI